MASLHQKVVSKRQQPGSVQEEGLMLCMRKDSSAAQLRLVTDNWSWLICRAVRECCRVAGHDRKLPRTQGLIALPQASSGR